MAIELAAGVTLYLSRHGETVANVQHRFQGRNDTPLTERGLENARMVGAILARQLGQRPAHFVCSPMPRARKTMEIALDTLKRPHNYDVDDRLMEIDLGAWAGLTDAEAKALDPAMWDKRVHDKWNVRVPGGGENYAMVADRIHSWVAGVRADTVAVSHGAWTRIFRGLFSGLTGQQMSDLDEPQNCVFEFKAGHCRRLEFEGSV